MYFLILFPFGIFIIFLIGGFFVSAPGYKGSKTEFFTGKTFCNYDGVEAKGFSEVIKWMFTRQKGHWEEIKSSKTAEPKTKEDELTIYFVNHATFLIQWRGINILTDPIWSQRSSPFQFAGPKRMRPPGIHFEDLPKIDLVLISHNHYDHLDLQTVTDLNKRDQPLFIVPLGVDLYLKDENISSIKSLDWWQEFTLKDLQINMVPAQHFSGRGMMDRDKTLWGGYVLSLDGEKIYFAGDTGYNKKMFDDINARHPSIDIGLLPIGAYKPRWFMSPIHISPEEAVTIHKQLGITKSIGMHYGTFPLADDSQRDPIDDLKMSLQKQSIPPDHFILMEPGEKISVGG